jgi:aminoglycoside phosphotransferase (APT) family kinase protein
VTQQPPANPEQIAGLLRAARPDWRLVRTWPLAGATSSRVSAIEAEQPDGRRTTLVLRQYGEANLRSDPHAAQTECRLLGLLAAAGLPVPRPYLADESGAFVPGPALLQEFIDGKRVDDPRDLAAFTGQLASSLACVHAAGLARADVPFLADVRDDVGRKLGTGPAHPDEYLSESAVRATLLASWPPPLVNQPVVLHGDYWPGNVLWRDGRLVGIIDWEDALFGDPLADLAITRLEISWLYGTAAMHLLTAQYCARRPDVDTRALPLWDLRAALRACGFDLKSWGLPDGQLASMRAAHRVFIASALRRVDGAAADGAGSADGAGGAA